MGQISRFYSKIEAFAQPQDRGATIGPRFDYLALAPAAAAICYPFLLQAFHAVVGTQAAAPSPLAIVGATLVVLIVHGVYRRAANRVWSTGVAISAVISAAIIAGMCGVRIS